MVLVPYTKHLVNQIIKRSLRRRVNGTIIRNIYKLYTFKANGTVINVAIL